MDLHRDEPRRDHERKIGKNGRTVPGTIPSPALIRLRYLQFHLSHTQTRRKEPSLSQTISLYDQRSGTGTRKGQSFCLEQFKKKNTGKS